MLVVEALLRRQEVRIGVERGALHIAFLRPPAGAAEGKGPSFGVHPGGIGGHDAVAVGAIGAGVGHPYPFAQRACLDVHVGGAANAAEKQPARPDSGPHLHPPGHVVEAGPIAPDRPAGLQVVHTHAIDRNERVLAIVTTDPESRLAEVEARYCGEGVPGGLQDAADVLVPQFAIQVVGGEGVHRQPGRVGRIGGIGRRSVEEGVDLGLCRRSGSKEKAQDQRPAEGGNGQWTRHAGLRLGVGAAQCGKLSRRALPWRIGPAKVARRVMQGMSPWR